MTNQGQGWHDDSKEHAEAAKGQNPKSTNNSNTNERGWHGDSEGHSEASKGQSPKSKGFMDKIKGD
jgi:hypothetical protein